MKSQTRLYGVALACCLSAFTAVAQVPGLLNYQGRVQLGSTLFDETGQFKFALVNADGSQAYWRNADDADQDPDGEPDAAVTLTVTQGLFSVLLGDETLANMNPLPASVFDNAAVYLRVWFSADGDSFSRLEPDHRVAAVAYALMSANVTDGSVSLEKLAPGILDAANLSGTLDPSQIPDLDAAKLVTGKLAEARLPESVADRFASLTLQFQGFSDRFNDLPGQVSSLSGQVSDLSAQVLSLSDQVRALADAVGAGAGGGGTVTVAGLTAVSAAPADAGLTALGFVPFSSVPAPGWVTGSGAGGPSARYGHTGVWTGTEMIVWGGTSGGSVYSPSGGIYEPAGDRWIRIATTDAPAARMGHSAVWTGTEMIVWGGFKSGADLNTGGRLVRDSQRWSGLPPEHAPEGRQEHAAVWTGSRMIVWGGRSTGGARGDGASYDPTSDLWAVLNVPNAPVPRFAAGAVWAGDRLIVWGGRNDTAALDSGAQLRFANNLPDRWEAITPTGAPAPRSHHSAIWTGTKMIVWGGDAGGGLLGDGAVYDPVADAWTALPTAGAPSARKDHDAFWTGSEMVIWGGSTTAGAVANGAAYDPERNAWRPLSTSGSPLARTASAAAWTGTELVVFGGRNSLGQPLASLQRLAPQPDWYFYRKP